MSFHVLHLFHHGCYLHKQRGRLYCKEGVKERSLPIENIKAIIVAARGVAFTADLLGALMDADCIILHCDKNYRPKGMSSPLFRTINQRIIEGQIRPRGGFLEKSWQIFLHAKINNQLAVLDLLIPDAHGLREHDSFKQLDEARLAGLYFRRYFATLEAKGQNRANRHQGWLNAFLNYGYAVLNAIVHRSIVVHGLLPHLGVHHRPRYGSWPLVYDLMEPWRPVVDSLTAIYLESGLEDSDLTDMGNYGFFIGNMLRDFRVPHKRYSVKLVDAVDASVRSFANACLNQNPAELWVPLVDSNHYQGVAVLCRDLLRRRASKSTESEEPE